MTDGGDNNWSLGEGRVDVVISFDTEFERGRDYSPDGLLKFGYKNKLLCYTFALIAPGHPMHQRYLDVKNGGSKKGRWNLPTFITAALRSVNYQIPEHKARKAEPVINVVLMAHFTRADLSAFRDWENIRKTDSLRQTYATTNKPMIREGRLSNGKKVKYSIRIIDTLLLAPDGEKSLAALGDIVGVPKIDPGTVIDENGDAVPAITRMSLLKEQSPDLFRRYATQDAVIPIKYIERLDRFFLREFELTAYHCPTVSGVGPKVIRRWDSDGVDAICGFQRLERGKERIPLYEQLRSQASAHYHGGMNTSFMRGYTPADDYYDIDIAGCYPTALAFARPIDWDGVRYGDSVTLDQVCSTETLGLGTVKFEFPRSVRFPTLPVRAGDALVFPRTGVSHCTGLEIASAINLGAEVELVDGIVMPFDYDDRIFLKLTQVTTEIRSRYESGTLENKLAKLVGNSLYGKIAQSVAGDRSSDAFQRTFDTKTGKYIDMPESSVTAAHIAAIATGFPRALLGELLNRLPEDAYVVSATTDGWLSNVPIDKVDTSGPVSQFWKALRSITTGSDDPEILEVKHGARQVVQMCTRGTLTAEPLEGYSPILAKAGAKLPEDKRGLDTMAQSRYLVCEFQNRTYESGYTFNKLTGIAAQWHAQSDLSSHEEFRRYSWNPCLKNQPLSVEDRNGLIYFQCEPWETADDYAQTIRLMKHWCDTRQRVIATVEDWLDFEAYQANVKMVDSGYNHTDTHSIAGWRRFIARQLIEDWGLSRSEVTKVGIDGLTTANQVKEARRGGDRTTPPKMVSEAVKKWVQTALERVAKYLAEGAISPDFCRMNSTVLNFGCSGVHLSRHFIRQPPALCSNDLSDSYGNRRQVGYPPLWVEVSPPTPQEIPVRNCEQCQGPISEEAAHNARFCSNRCKQQYHYRRRNPRRG